MQETLYKILAATTLDGLEIKENAKHRIGRVVQIPNGIKEGQNIIMKKADNEAHVTITSPVVSVKYVGVNYILASTRSTAYLFKRSL